jgi:NAD(P)-dependent dehydrogenase (short-subunit alcohol dehydrogenase family)
MTVTLVTGANKGLGFETARQLIERGHTVYIGARSVERGDAAAAKLGGQFVQLDVTDDASVRTAFAFISSREGHLDVLVNNAGVSTTADINGQIALEVFDTNATGIIRVTQAALPLLRGLRTRWWSTSRAHLAPSGRSPIRGDASSTSLPLSTARAKPPMLTVQYAKALPEIKFNAVEPGFTATDLTPFSEAGQPIEKGAEVIVRMATIGKDGPTGTFQEGDGELDW